jgi:hypothetical protein
MMLNFDAAERHFCSVRRQKTSTPLQALVTLNDPQFVEAAKVLAQRSVELKNRKSVEFEMQNVELKNKKSVEFEMQSVELKNKNRDELKPTRYSALAIRHSALDPRHSIEFIFTALTSRPPRANEVEALMQLYQDELVDFQRKPQRANELLSVGEFVMDKNLDKKQLAALTVVASTVMNFDEFVIKR